MGLITLRVPGESGNPATTKVEVRIPDDIQIRTVLAQPVPGWRLAIKKEKTDPPIYRDDGTPVEEVVSSVTWTATGPGIQRGEFDDFVLEAGPLPDVETLSLPTFQTFADGTPMLDRTGRPKAATRSSRDSAVSGIVGHIQLRLPACDHPQVSPTAMTPRLTRLPRVALR